MGFATIFLTAIGLSMDAFAISLSSGMCLKQINFLKALKFGLFFGFFQFAMPVLGFFLAFSFSEYIQAFDHWVAFILLCFIGGKMIYETFGDEDLACDTDNNDESITNTKNMLIMAVATSIDAMAVGISFAFLKVDVLSASVIIGVITCLLSIIGVFLGNKVSGIFQKSAGRIGGIILILIGAKILLEHTLLA
ncbi:manganese efflux pump MntP family protein [Tyzzerella sp. OttesenSCG-928-J15]|nr:manganese efflux pump MntP family protein [Tyzzerella sp. OttesenSCG-928-J15]